MPYKKRNKTYKKQSTKKKLKKNVEQKKVMTTRLMIINLKVDDFIYKKKPITTQEANMYAEELETFRHQCCDERYLQVIEKLTSYMKFFIEQLSKDIVDVNIVDPIEKIVDPIEPIEKLDIGNDHVQNAPGPEYHSIDIEMERSISNLSIVDPKDPLIISDINNNLTVTKETLNEVEHQVVNVNIEKNGLKYTNTCNIKAIGQKQTDMVDNSSEQPQNILSGFKYDNNYYLNLADLGNDTKKESQQILEDIPFKMTNNNINIVNNNKLELSNQDADSHNCELSQNLLSNFEHGNGSTLTNLHINTNSYKNKSYHVGDRRHKIVYIKNKVSKYDITNTGKNNIKLEGSKQNVTEQKEICDDINKLSQNLYFPRENHAPAYVGHNNTKLSNNQVSHLNDTVNIADMRNRVINFNNIKTGNNKPKLKEVSNLKATKLKETCGYKNKQINILNCVQNNKNLSDNQLYHVDNTNNNIAGTRNKLHNDNMNTGINNNNTKLTEASKLNATKQKDHGDSNDLSQNILSSFQYGNCAVIDVNQKSSNYVNNIANTTIKNTKFTSLPAIKQKEIGINCNKPSQNLRGNFDTAIGDSQSNTNSTVQQTQLIVGPHYTNYMKNSNSKNTIVSSHFNGQKPTNNPLQNQNPKNIKKQRNTAKKTNEKTTKKKSYSRKSKITQSKLNKERIFNQTVKGDTEPKTSVNNSIQKKKRVVINKKKEEIDLSWVESMKFIRTIGREEFFKFDNIEESFWSDLTMPPNINLNDFEYDNINIWKS